MDSMELSASAGLRLQGLHNQDRAGEKTWSKAVQDMRERHGKTLRYSTFR